VTTFIFSLIVTFLLFIEAKETLFGKTTVFFALKIKKDKKIIININLTTIIN